MKLLLKIIPESLGLVLVTGYKNRPNLILDKFQTAIIFSHVVKIRHILYGFGAEK